MITQEKLDGADTLLSIVQRCAIILGIGVGAVLYFVRLEHTPSVGTTFSVAGLDGCLVKAEMTVQNLGKSPFTLVNAVLNIDGRFIDNDSALPQQIAASEAIGIVFDFTTHLAGSERIGEAKISLKIAEDDPDTWRISDQLITIPAAPEGC